MESMHFQNCTVAFSEEITQKPARSAVKHMAAKVSGPRAKLALSGNVPFVPRSAKVLARPALDCAQTVSSVGVNSDGGVEMEPANDTQDLFRKMLGDS